jgi:hypothetical protein
MVTSNCLRTARCACSRRPVTLPAFLVANFVKSFGGSIYCNISICI